MVRAFNQKFKRHVQRLVNEKGSSEVEIVKQALQRWINAQGGQRLISAEVLHGVVAQTLAMGSFTQQQAQDVTTFYFSVDLSRGTHSDDTAPVVMDPNLWLRDCNLDIQGPHTGTGDFLKDHGAPPPLTQRPKTVLEEPAAEEDLKFPKLPMISGLQQRQNKAKGSKGRSEGQYKGIAVSLHRQVSAMASRLRVTHALPCFPPGLVASLV